LDLDKTAFTIYLITLVLSPLLFGAVHTYAYTIMSLGVLVGGLLLVIKNIQKDPKTKAYKVQLPRTSLNFAFILLFAFLVFQVIPLPDFLLEFLSPEAMVVARKSLPPSITVISESPARDWFSLSPYYYPVRMSIIRWTVYALFFLGLTQVLNSQRRIELTIFLILITACFEALYGLAEAYSGSGHIWWFKKMMHGFDVTGTYINRNHLAGLMEMCVLLAVSYAGALSTRKIRREIILERKTSLRSRFSRFLSGEQRFNKRTLILFIGAVIGIGLVFSASRGGMISAAGAMLCMSLFFIFRKDHRKKGFIILFLFLITSVYALYIGAEYPIGRFKYFYMDIKARARLAQKTMDMFDDYKVTGIGVGNFQYAYPKYQASEDKNVFIRHAHNDWAQFLAEAGIIGFCLFLAGLCYYVYQILQLWRKRTDPFAICLGITPFAVMIAMAIHSYSDFNLHIPANCLMFLAIMAIGYSALHLTRHRGRGKTLYRYHTIYLKYKGIVALLVVFGLITWSGIWAIRHFMAEVFCNTVTNSTLNRDQNPPLGEIKKAIKKDRWNAEYWYKLARNIRKIQDSTMGNLKVDDEDRHKYQMEIIGAMEEAVRLNPFKAEYHIRLGWDYTSLWKDLDYRQRWLPAADISMERAAYFAGEKNPSLHVHLGNYWTFRSKTIDPANPEWETSWSKACWYYKKAQNLERKKQLVDKIVQYVWRHYPDKEFVRKVLLIDNQSFLEDMK
jgi:O-antigen ligase